MKSSMLISFLFPPNPPSISEEIDYIPGEFEYIHNESDKIMLITAYKAINLLELWSFIKKDREPFATSDPNINKIYNKIEELGYYGHSGMSFLCTLRDIQFIAKYGETKFKENYEKYQKKRVL